MNKLYFLLSPFCQWPCSVWDIFATLCTIIWIYRFIPINHERGNEIRWQYVCGSPLFVCLGGFVCIVFPPSNLCRLELLHLERALQRVHLARVPSVNVTSVPLNTYVQIPLWCADLGSFRHMCRSGMAGSHGFMFSALRDPLLIFRGPGLVYIPPAICKGSL